MRTIQTGIIGLNRRTASLGLALRAYGNKPDADMRFDITGQDGDKNAMKKALEMGALDQSGNDTRKIAAESNLIILDLPASLHAEVVAHFAPRLKAGCVVLDLSSQKKPVIALAEETFPKNAEGKAQAYLVGVQPLVGQTAVFDARDDVSLAQADLFQNAEMIIAPDVHCPEEAVKLASDLTMLLGMRTRFLLPEEYDALADFTEGLPLLLSFALFASMVHADGRADLLRTVNPAFASLLQNLIGANSADMLALWRGNPQSTQARIDDLIRVLSDLRELVSASYDDELKDYVQETLTAFQDWDIRRTMGKWAEDEDSIKAPTLGGSLGGLFGGFGIGKRDDKR